MLTREQVDSFDRDGYLLVPNVLTDEEVTRARALLRAKFELPPERRRTGDTGTMLFDVYSQHADLRWLLFHDRTLGVLRTLLGPDFAVVRECSAMLNHFEGSWHKDSSRHEGRGHAFSLAPDFLMVQVAYYLQDNGPEYGGGLDVDPGSHRGRDPFIAHGPVGKVAERLYYRAALPVLRRLGREDDAWRDRHVRAGVSIPNKAGDLVIFHQRATHRPTQPRQPVVPPDREKVALFVMCGRNNAHVRAYHDYIRGVYAFLGDFAYPEDFRAEATKRGVTLV
ncbi:MAG TPA: phytanoyl-CoA dioxygenase family protein [Candidatus Acidoferrum sp.]|nr:phytanoyl-CoA dioxygenase family protein [Candidatus Acidoferrum sp.]